MVRQARGCETETEYPIYTLDGVDIRRCPLRLITPESIEYLKLYAHYKLGHLPNEGGLYDQPLKYIQAMETIAGALQELMREERGKNAKQ